MSRAVCCPSWSSTCATRASWTWRGTVRSTSSCSRCVSDTAQCSAVKNATYFIYLSLTLSLPTPSSLCTPFFLPTPSLPLSSSLLLPTRPPRPLPQFMDLIADNSILHYLLLPLPGQETPLADIIGTKARCTASYPVSCIHLSLSNACMSIYQSICVCVCVSVCLSVCLSVCVYLLICLLIPVSV